MERSMLLALVLGGLPAAAFAAGPSTAGSAGGVGQAKVEVTLIHATKEKGKGDAPPGAAKRLAQAFPGYHSFRKLRTDTLRLASGKSGTAKLPEKRTLSVTYLGKEGKLLKLKVEIPPKLKTTVRVKDGGTFYQAGINHRGGTLILALKATSG